MIDLPMPPALVLLIGGLLCGLLRGQARNTLLVVAPLLTLLAVWQVADGVQLTLPFLGYSLQILVGGETQRLIGSVFALALLGGNLFALNRARWWELTAAQLYAAGAMGVIFAGDLISLLLFWEVMVVFATVLIWCGGDEAARRAGIRFAILQLLGGMALKLGVEGVKLQTGSIDLQPLVIVQGTNWLLLVGLLVNVAAAPLSVWFTDALPRSTPTGSVFLVPFSTVTAVVVLLRLFPGEGLLLGIGLWMMVHGMAYALAQSRPRRMIAYAALAQLGGMVCGIGLGTPHAINGVVALAGMQVVIFTLLMMSASATLLLPGGGCGILSPVRYSAPLMPWCALVGLLGLAAVPLTGGYTARLLLAEGAPFPLWVALQIFMAGNVLVAIRLGWLLRSRFLAGLPAARASRGITCALVLLALLSVMPGLWPGGFHQFLPSGAWLSPYTRGQLLAHLQLLLFAGLAGIWLLPRLKQGEHPPTDLDWLWRVAGFAIAQEAVEVMRRLRTASLALAQGQWEKVRQQRWPEAVMSYRSTNGMIFWAVLTLLVLVLAKALSSLQFPG